MIIIGWLRSIEKDSVQKIIFHQDNATDHKSDLTIDKLYFILFVCQNS